MTPGEGGKQMLIDVSSLAAAFVDDDGDVSDILWHIAKTSNGHEVNELVKFLFKKFYDFAVAKKWDMTDQQWVLAFTAVLNTCGKLRPATAWYVSRKGFQFLTENTKLSTDLFIEHAARRPVGFQIRLKSEAANEINYFLVPGEILNSTKEPWVLTAFDSLGASTKHRSEGELQSELANFILIDVTQLFTPYFYPKGCIVQRDSAIVFSLVQ